MSGKTHGPGEARRRARARGLRVAVVAVILVLLVAVPVVLAIGTDIPGSSTDYLHFAATDAQGAAGHWQNTTQTVSITATPTADSTVTVHFTDGGVGSLQTATRTQTATFDFVVGTEGSHVITFWATDTSSTSTPETPNTPGRINIDRTIPTVTAVTTPSLASGWYKTDVTLALTPTDTASGVQKTEYREEGAPFWTLLVGDEATFTTVDDAGIFTYDYRAVDWAGNPSAVASVVINIDTIHPTTFGKAVSGKVHKPISVKYKIKDNVSPKAQNVVVKIKNSKGKVVLKKIWSATKTTFTWYSFNWKPKSKGTYKYYVYAKDLAGNSQSTVGWAKIKVK